MISIYIESNFLLELALEQEEFASCHKILQLCQEKKIELILPAYSLVEPYEKLIRTTKNRKIIYENLEQELHQLKRTASYENKIEKVINDIDNLLIKSQEKDKKSFINIQAKLLKFATIIPLNTEILIKIQTEKIEELYNLSPQDAIVFSSVITHLTNNRQKKLAYFLNKNTKDFLQNLEIKEIFKYLKCKIIGKFKHGYDCIVSNLE